jgi:hypothetical protein
MKQKLHNTHTHEGNTERGKRREISAFRWMKGREGGRERWLNPENRISELLLAWIQNLSFNLIKV